MRYVRILMLLIVGFFLLPMLALAQDTLQRVAYVDRSIDLLTGLIALLTPILTGYVTKALVNVFKGFDAFAAANPLIKQAMTFVIAFALSWIAGHFGNASVGVILNTVIGGALAQVFYNGKKISALSAPAVERKISES